MGSASSGGGGGKNPSYYFLQRAESTNKGDDGGEVVELPPEGANSGEFDSRPVVSTLNFKIFLRWVRKVNVEWIPAAIQ